MAVTWIWLKPVLEAGMGTALQQLLTPGEIWPCRLPLLRLEGGSRARSEASDSRGADTRHGGD